MTSHMASTLAIVLFTVAWMSSDANVIKLGEMSPSNPLVASGDTLVINCTLHTSMSVSGSRPADDIFFTVGLERLPSHYVHVLDPLTAQLRWPNMTRAHSDSHIFCYWHNISFSVSQEAIVVADMPKKPVVTGCRVYNWNRMVCQWEPAVQDTGIETNQTLYWTLLSDTDQWNPCTRQTRNTCVWEDEVEDFLHMIHDYYLVIKVTSALLARALYSTVVHIVPSDKVQPDHPLNFSVVTNTLSLVTLSWLPAPGNKTVVSFRINYTSQWSPTQVSVLTDGSTLNLVNLVPFTSYWLTVEARPGRLAKQTGDWSEPAMLTLRTPSDVPGAAPLVTGGGYSVDELSTSRELTLYWQEIPVMARHGDIVEYVVSIYCLDMNLTSILCDTSYVSSDRLYADKLKLSVGQSYSFTVEAMTSAGRNMSLTLHAVTVLAPNVIKLLAANRVRHFVAVRDRQSGHVSLSWLAPQSHTSLTGYTIYWCQAPMEALLCKKGLQWLHVPANQTTYNFTVTSPELSEQLRFASSAEYEFPTASGRVSSGLLWSQCTYDLHRPLASPSRVTLSERMKDVNTVLVVTWQRPGCTASGYIAAYGLFYCDVTANTCTNMTDTNMVTVATNDSNKIQYEYTISDVVSGHKYSVSVRSVSPDTRPSPWTEPVTASVGKEGVSGIVTLVAVLSVVIVLVIVSLVVVLRLRKHQCCRNTYEPNVPVPLSPATQYTSANLDYRGYQLDIEPLGSDQIIDNGHAVVVENRSHINGSLSAAVFTQHPLVPQRNNGRQVGYGEMRGLASDGQEGEALLMSGSSGVPSLLASDGQGGQGQEKEALLASGTSDFTAAGDSPPLALYGNRQHVPAAFNDYNVTKVGNRVTDSGSTDLAAYSQLNVHLVPNNRGYVRNALSDSEPAVLPETASDSESDLHLNNNKGPPSTTLVSVPEGSTRATPFGPSGGYVTDCMG